MAASYLVGPNLVYRPELEVLRTILDRNLAAINRLRFDLYGVVPPGTRRPASYLWPTMLNWQRFRDLALLYSSSPLCLGEAAAMSPRGGPCHVSHAGSRSRSQEKPVNTKFGSDEFLVQVINLSGDTFKYYSIDCDWTGEMLYAALQQDLPRVLQLKALLWGNVLIGQHDTRTLEIPWGNQTVLPIHAVITKWEPIFLKKNGFLIGDLKCAGYTATDLKRAGFPLRALRGAGYTVADAMGAGYPVRTGWATYKDAGYTAAECIAGGFSEHDLWRSDFPLAECQQLKLPETTQDDDNIDDNVDSGGRALCCTMGGEVTSFAGLLARSVC